MKITRRFTVKAEVEQETGRLAPLRYAADITLIETEEGNLRVESVTPTPEDAERMRDAWWNS